ncbi:MAG: hypothetical protein KAQ65_12130 [Candidatus Thorarchaeota archaeon]|nr:hypothetical protein [Candidatus Thorarchaeota archaeon]
MGTRRQYFDEPIVRIGIEDARFPRMCPICGADAEHAARISASPHKIENPRYATRKKSRLMSNGTKTLMVYVCDEHYQSDEGQGNSRVACTLGSGLMVAMLLFAIMIAGGDIWSGRPVNYVFYAIVFLFSVVLIFSFFAFRPGPLASSIKVIGFDLGFRNIWLQFKRADYRERFVEENAMKVELVRWIAKL